MIYLHVAARALQVSHSYASLLASAHFSVARHIFGDAVLEAFEEAERQEQGALS